MNLTDKEISLSERILEEMSYKIESMILAERVTERLDDLSAVVETDNISGIAMKAESLTSAGIQAMIKNFDNSRASDGSYLNEYFIGMHACTYSTFQELIVCWVKGLKARYYTTGITDHDEINLGMFIPIGSSRDSAAHAFLQKLRMDGTK